MYIAIYTQCVTYEHVFTHRSQGSNVCISLGAWRPLPRSISWRNTSELLTIPMVMTAQGTSNAPSTVGQNPTEQTNYCWVTVTHATRMILVRHYEYKSNRLTTVFITFTGSKTLKFSTLAEFHLWREREEPTYTTYVKGQQTYHPHGTGIHKISNTTAVQIQKCFVY